MNESTKSRMFPERYNDNVNFIILGVFLVLFGVSCFLLAHDSFTQIVDIKSVGKFCAVFSLAGVGTVIFSGFFKSIGIFKDSRTVLAGAVAIFFIFGSLSFIAFHKINSLDIANYNKDVGEIGRISKENQSLRDELLSVKDENNELLKKINSEGAIEAIERYQIIDLIKEKVGNKGGGFSGIKSVVFHCEGEDGFKFLSQSGLSARNEYDAVEKINSDSSGKFSLSRGLSSDLVIFRNKNHQKMFDLKFVDNTFYISLNSDGINNLCSRENQVEGGF
ncbi:hypothetical protein [Vibrio alfacsensis]|uniref:hypothetical protein n=1 Tax=Vibrio TaxID=662 RepID=UPI004067CF08